MVGGEPAVLERVRPYLLALGPTITHVGPLGLAARAQGPRQAHLDGFDLHAYVRVPPTIGPGWSISAGICSGPRWSRIGCGCGPMGG